MWSGFFKKSVVNNKKRAISNKGFKWSFTKWIYRLCRIRIKFFIDGKIKKRNTRIKKGKGIFKVENYEISKVYIKFKVLV